LEEINLPIEGSSEYESIRASQRASDQQRRDFYEIWCDRLSTEKGASTEPINDLSIKHGLTGNVYCTSKSKKILERVCDKIGKSKNSIYFNEKYKVFAIRVKAKHHKKKIKNSVF